MDKKHLQELKKPQKTIFSALNTILNKKVILKKFTKFTKVGLQQTPPPPPKDCHFQAPQRMPLGVWESQTILDKDFSKKKKKKTSIFPPQRMPLGVLGVKKVAILGGGVAVVP